MASTSDNPAATNLAALLLIKRKLGSSSEKESDTKLAIPAPTIGAHSKERITYHQTAPAEDPSETNAAKTKTNDQSKTTRKTKQLEVSALDQKLDEINRRQEEKTNAALDSWKGFDSLNYGFSSTPATTQPTPVPSAAPQQRVPTPLPQRDPSPVKQYSPKEQPQSPPKRVESPVKIQTVPKSPPQEKNTSPQPSDEKQPSPPPTPPKEKPVENRPTSVPQTKAITPPPPEEIKPRTSMVTESIVPISTAISDPQIFQRNTPPAQMPPSSIYHTTSFKPFPDIGQNETRKHRKAVKSIQKSMDRYRFHVW